MCESYKDIIIVPGASKVSCGGIIPAVLENTNDVVLVATTSERFKDIDEIVFKEMPVLNYKVLYANEQHSISEFLQEMFTKKIRVGFINTSYQIYEELLSVGSGNVWLSSCREGILHYLTDIERVVLDDTYILCFDNDQEMLMNVKSQCKNQKIHIIPCTIHCVCSYIGYDYSLRKAMIICSRDCTLSFPPEGNILKSHFNNTISPFSTRTQLQYSDTIEEYEHHKMTKLICINVLHSLLCILAYIEGTKKGYAIREIASMRFEEILDKQKSLAYVLNVHSNLFDKYLASYAAFLNQDKIIYTEVVKTYIEGLFSTGEFVGRGLNSDSASYISKRDRHFPILRGIENSDLVILIEQYEEIVKK